MTSDLAEVSSSRCFGGIQKVYSHQSKQLGCRMNFSIYLPPKAIDGTTKLPSLYWLSGLTCSEQNFIIKSGFQRYAAQNDLIVVGPDTSPRGLGIAGEDTDWDFGTGAGFYVDASQPQWKNYRMYSYVTTELPELIEKNFTCVQPGRMSISGHSMGGHGAMVCALRNPGLYVSCSAFAPISNPTKCPWGRKALAGYLGENEETWTDWDACDLVQKYFGPDLKILVDQGDADPYLEEQLMPNNLLRAFTKANVPVVIRMREGYDHGYFFVSTYIEEHIKHHANLLRDN